MKYLKKYSTDAEYQADTKSIPQVSWVDETEKVEYEFPVPPEHDYSQDYLTFVALEDGTFKFNKQINYSVDDGQTWTALAANTDSPTVTAGNKILWKATGLTTSWNGGIGEFKSSGQFEVEGNIMSLVSGDSFSQATTVTTKQFMYMFRYLSGLTSAENLVLPATTMAQSCCIQMFVNCTNLTTAPALPATALDTNCYNSMFASCSSLTTAPELPATTLATSCYQQMFAGCSNLNSITCLATDISAPDCIKRWTDGVASTGTFTKATSMTGWSTGTSGIPNNWTVEDFQE